MMAVSELHSCILNSLLSDSSKISAENTGTKMQQSMIYFKESFAQNTETEIRN